MAIVNEIVSNNENHEPLRLMLIGSHETVTHVIRVLHEIGFANAGDWGPLQPTKNAGEFITILDA